MLKKKTLTEVVYNNGDPFQFRKAIDACIGSWQKREDVQILWETLKIEMVSREYDEVTYSEYQSLKNSAGYCQFNLSVEAVYDARVE